MTLDYRDEIRSDIAHEFGLEAAGYGPKQKLIPIRIAQRIVAKYPHIEHLEALNGRPYYEINPKALQISKRYMAIFGGYL